MRAILVRMARRRLALREHRCNRCEKIAPVKAGREALRLPLDVPAAHACGTALNQLEQAIARADIPPAVRLDNNGRARSADAGIDNAKKDLSRREPFGVGR